VPAAEVCTDALDNDCDALVDCADPNCAAAPACAPPVEVCGDCRDNDADRLVDYEDPDCCAQADALRLKKLRLRPADAKPPYGNRLNLRSVAAELDRATFDPLAQDTSVQVADEAGQMFCATITADHWMRRNRRSVVFWDTEGTFAGGLADGLFRTKRNGRVLFRTHGPVTQLRAMHGRDIRITVRVGGQCLATAATLRPKKAGFVYP
jgi:hypothetical protein